MTGAGYEYRLFSTFAPHDGALFVKQADLPAWLEELNAAGRDGWEVVAEIAVRVTDTTTSYPQLLLKRPLPPSTDLR